SKPIKNIFFHYTDSTTLVEQNRCLNNLTIPKSALGKFKFTCLENGKIPERYIQFSFPIFSKDNKKAYIEYDQYNGFDGGGQSIYLQKIRGKWKVIEITRNWNS